MTLIFVVGVILIQFVLSLLLYKIIPSSNVEQSVLIAIDLSYFFAFIVLYFLTKRYNVKYLQKSNLYTAFFVVVFIVFFLFSEGFRFSNFFNFSSELTFKTIGSLYSKTDTYKLFRTLIIIPILEEFIFRKFLFKLLALNRTKLLIPIIITNLAFSFLHLDFDYFLILFISGLLLSNIYLRSQNILIPILAHSFVNLLILYFY